LKKKTYIGIVDYKMGNHASVVHCLRDLNFRVSVSDDPSVLSQTDLLVLPGVGAYPTAMKSLSDRNLVAYLQEKAKEDKPIIGICLGMQLLTEASHEHEYTSGLGLIPGEVVPLSDPKWHIGWNTVDCVQDDPVMQIIDGKAFYFNHSYAYEGPSEYQLCVSDHQKTFPCVIRNGNTVGLQFHPEKSQAPGRELLRNLVLRMCDA
jgi:imidazole glycerol-phosphate synthase subunit HisH